MADPRMRDDELEATLRDIGRRLDHPSATQTAARVRARLRERRAERRAPRFRLAPALLTAAVLLLIVALGVPAVRATADELLRVRGIDLFRVPAVSSPPPAALAIPGERMSLEDARRRVSFPIRVPAVRLGAPDEVIVDRGAGAERVTLVYGARPGLPASSVAGVSALIVELRGSVDGQLLGKAAGPGTRIESVPVGGAPGYWLEGAPHLFFYRDTSGSVRDETLRLAGNTLLWERDGITLRLEAQVSRDEAVRIAASMR